MIKNLKKIFVLIAVAAVALSCSNLILLDSQEETPNEGNLKLTVNGVVSDVASNLPLSGMKITLSAYAENSPSLLPDANKTVFTDSKGVYTIEAAGFSGPVTCMVTAESPEETDVRYETVTNKVVVTWSGNSFDAETNTAYVNECNFQMKKAD